MYLTTFYLKTVKALGPLGSTAGASSLPGGSSKFFNRIAKKRLSIIKLPTMKIKMKISTHPTPLDLK
jgi:hypothetical protein